MDKQYGVEGARQQLPELLERANRGESILITKHGAPYAALVEPSAANRRPGNFARLRGSGKGLWGRDSRRFVESLRNEW
jgi:prevent-host-death family protein